MMATAKTAARSECVSIRDSSAIPESICRVYLEKVAGSFCFGRAAQLKKLLKWLGERSLAVAAVPPTEKEIAAAVLDRLDFDPQTDSLVRKEMGRLREKLARYYRAEGLKDEVRIGVDAGYLPVFEWRTGGNGDRLCWLVLPFRSPAELIEDSDRVLEELLVGLGSAGAFDLVAPTTALGYRGKSGDVRQFAAECRADLVVEGSLRRQDFSFEGTAWVVDGQSGRAERFRRVHGSDACGVAQELAAWLLAKS